MNYLRVLSLIALILFAFIVGVEAQCPMCRIAAESNLENGGSAGKGLNTGILYMLTLPYFIVALIGYVWYRNRKKEGSESDEATLVLQPSE